MYELRFDKDAAEFYRQADKALVKRLNRCFECLSENPLTHPNIKPLVGTLTGLYRYRVGDWRVIYEVMSEDSVINILQIVHRSRAYRQ
jgi:mRNA interferase RelE/StbE